MFLRCGKNQGDEGSLFQWLLAMAAAATTAMYFSPISEIWAFGNADQSVESTYDVTKAEQWQGTVKPLVDSNEADQSLTCGGSLFLKNLDSEP